MAGILAGVGAAGAAGAAASAVTPGATTALIALLTSWGFRRDAVRVAVKLTTVRRGGQPRGAAGTVTWEAEPTFSALFLVNATRRIHERLNLGKPVEEAVRPERRYLEQRERAWAARREAAAAVDRLLEEGRHLEVNGRPVLVWRAHTDDKVTPECRAADGRWFYADTPPVIGYPGMPHGGTCRCWPRRATAADVRTGSVDEAVRSVIGAPSGHTPQPFPSGLDTEREAAAS